METAVLRVQTHCYADRSGRPAKCNRTAALAGPDWQRFFMSSPAFWPRGGNGRSPEGRQRVSAKDSVAVEWIRTRPEWFRRSIIPPAWPFGALLPPPRALGKCFPAPSVPAYLRSLFIYLSFASSNSVPLLLLRGSSSPFCFFEDKDAVLLCVMPRWQWRRSRTWGGITDGACSFYF